MADVRGDLSRHGPRDGAMSDVTIAADRTDDGDHRRRGIVRLALCAIVIGLVWCVVLPRLARHPSMREYSGWLDERGIDPSAMYYTELELMEPILYRLERSQQPK